MKSKARHHVITIDSVRCKVVIISFIAVILMSMTAMKLSQTQARDGVPITGPESFRMLLNNASCMVASVVYCNLSALKWGSDRLGNLPPWKVAVWSKASSVAVNSTYGTPNWVLGTTNPGTLLWAAKATYSIKPPTFTPGA